MPASRPLFAALALALSAAPLAARAEQAAEPRVTLTGYGEIDYLRPLTHPAQATADLRRFVFGLQVRFDERTRFVSEVEIEHAIVSSEDPGELELEQAYVERRFGATWSGRAGLVLVPVGLLNENHEPTAYHGVERNLVETRIIPSTWREGAVTAIGAFEGGLTVQVGVGTGFDLGAWDATSTEGREKPLGSIHQELVQARARDLSAFGAVNWRGLPGLHLGAAAFVGRASQGQDGLPASTVSLWDVHARWTPWRLDLSALYARGAVTRTAALNAPLVAPGATLVPASFDGWYLQGALNAWSDGAQALTPFVRYEQLNTGRSYADLGAGLTPEPLPTEGVVTAGLDWRIADGVVVKADVQLHEEDSDRNRLALGLGWSF